MKRRSRLALPYWQPSHDIPGFLSSPKVMFADDTLVKAVYPLNTRKLGASE